MWLFPRAMGAKDKVTQLNPSFPHPLQVFDGVSGARVQSFGTRGLNKGQFESPECILVDPQGFILVGDSGNGRVQVFRPNGNFVR